ncbi:ATPase [Thalassospira alkalitolerans]|uniref:histidine kinase n=1 Tax=Thalassospira alkalitolerans TaxID=1293890 RepID=A0A1Y2LF96_9PROT|nr:ATPase [Thalassospira alkalitolerans]
MGTTIRIPRIRRTYNRWVANQTLEDYALRFTAYKVRRFSSWRIANTAIGAVSFLALEAIGGSITLNYGFENAFLAIIVAAVIIFLMGVPISYNAAKFGVDIDLLSRGAGFGYIGSTITSLIYASFTFIFFAIEAAIIATALELCAGVPVSLGYIISALVIIPLVTHGVTFISRFQAWTQPFWVVLQIAPFVFIAMNSHDAVRQWTGYTGLLGPLDGSFAIAPFGAASAVLFSLVAQIGEQVDYLRFLPRKDHRNRVAWWTALLCAGPGWIVIGALKILGGSFLAFYAFQNGVTFADASDPTRMYLNVFQEMLASPELALGVTGIFVVICQLKINVTNSYAGSIAWSNFFSRLTHSHPGRVVWLVFNVLIGLLLMEFGVYKALEHILGLYSIAAVAWMACIVSNLVINKPLGLAPRHIEFKRAHLYDVNPVGCGAMCIAILLALLAYSGLFGDVISKLYSYVALISAFALVPIIAVLTKSRYYLARSAATEWAIGETEACCICEHRFDREDMAHCPAYSGPICSLCCSLDSRCHDMCKPHGRFSGQIRAFATTHFSAGVGKWVNTRIAHYLGMLLTVTGVLGLAFWLIYFETRIDIRTPPDIIGLTLTKLFVIIFVISGIVVWLFVLAQENRRFAEEEARRHTGLLMDEIAAHNETDRQLKQAKEAAESANLAKSRYMVGLSHELRTPLSAILGYAQLLERQSNGQPPYIHNAAQTIKRSGEHLAGMIEGLLDISKIEAGRLEIYRYKAALRPFLDQIVDMFTLMAQSKGIAFDFQPISQIPSYVYTDEKRLRQVLINLLSNAIKFTHRGTVSFSIRYSNQIATFEIRDTGIGIDAKDIDRIFLPFERAEQPSDIEQTPGTGLGLTITKLLVDIMGGELVVQSEPGKGTCFTIRMMLSSTGEPDKKERLYQSITGYAGPRRTILVADDDADQRALLEDTLLPLGFNVVSTTDGHACLSSIALNRPDVIILDIAMPGLSGWEVAKRVRQGMDFKVPILMLSADAGSERTKPEYKQLHDAYLVKPFVLDDLFDRLATLMSLSWAYDDAADGAVVIPDICFDDHEIPPPEKLRQLATLGQIGFVRSIEVTLKDIEVSHPDTVRFCQHMLKLTKSFRLKDFLAAIEEVGQENV